MWDDVYDYLREGVATLALLHNGGIKTSCEDCPKSEQEVRKCLFITDVNKLDDEPVFASPELNIEYISCPISSIPQVVYRLYDRYKFIEKMNQPATPDNTSSIMWWFIKTYEYYDYKVKEYQHKKEMKKQNRKGKR